MFLSKKFERTKLTQIFIFAFKTMIIDKITKELVQKILLEANKKDNIEKIKKQIIDPIIKYALQHMYPYIIVTSITFFLTFIIAVAILIFTLRR